MYFLIWCVCMLSHSFMSDSLQPHGPQAAGLLCPWNFPGKSTGAGNHFLLHRLFLTQGLNLRLLYLLLWQVNSYHWATWKCFCYSIAFGKLFIYLFLAVSHDLWALSSPARDSAWVLGSGSRVLVTRPPGHSLLIFRLEDSDIFSILHCNRPLFSLSHKKSVKIPIVR